jgi:polyhydroxyalkanoate synthesis regulator phasin
MKKMDESYTQALLEEIRSQNKAVVEAMNDMKDKVDKIPGIDNRLKSVESDVKVIKAAVTMTDKELKSLERRVTHLEAA